MALGQDKEQALGHRYINNGGGADVVSNALELVQELAGSADRPMTCINRITLRSVLEPTTGRF